jgi:general secretion pathway protein G
MITSTGATRVRNAALRTAFTLMEMLVVVAIIVMLAGVGGFYFVNQQRHSQKKTAEIQVRALTQMCEAFATNNNTEYPRELPDLLREDVVGGPYLKTVDGLVDPWGQQYQYVFPGTINGGRQPDIWTDAPDGTRIGNWSKYQQ